MNTTCPPTGNIGYSSKREAERAAKETFNQAMAEKGGAHELYAYRCRLGCGKWHLTKQRPR